MGCGSSEANLPSNSVYGSKCDIVDCLSAENKKKIRKIIEKDTLIQLILLLNQLNIPLNAELSDTKSKWQMTHFCARWNSSNCLQYLLKNYFIGSALGYIDFVNSTTVDRETPLHICSTWKSDKAFAVLHYFGGLNLNARDNRMRSPLDTALQSKSKNISQVLKNYRNANINFTMVEPQKLASGSLISQDPTLIDKDKQLKVNKNLQKNEQFVTEQQKNLRQQKKIMQQKIQQLQQEKVKKQLEAQAQKEQMTNHNRAINQKLKNEQQMQQKIQQKAKQQRQRYEALVKNQQRQLQKLKQQLRMMQDNRIVQQKLEAQKKAEKYAAEEQAKLKELALQKEQKVKKLKQKEQQQHQEEVQNPENNKQNKQKKQVSVEEALKGFRQSFQGQPQLEQVPRFEQLYKKAIEQGQFFDQQFPADIQSIGNPEDKNYYNIEGRVVWLRPAQIFGEDAQFQLYQEGVDPNDIQQGQLGVCYMLAALSSLAKSPDNITSMFVFADPSVGFYILKLFINGIPKFFVLDDLIPCDADTYSPLFTKPVGNQLWVMLIEKCWAKAIGTYLSAEGMQPSLMMEDLSGAPGFAGFFNDPNSKLSLNQHIQVIFDHYKAGHNIVISTGLSNIPQGLLDNHAYTLLDVYKVSGNYIFKARNPWGNTEYEGMYSQRSQMLTPQIKKAIDFDSNKQDGIFFLSQSQLQQYFSDYSISVLRQGFIYTYYDFQSGVNQNKFFKFTLKNDSLTNVRVTQAFKRMVQDPNYSYASVILEVGKIQKNGSVTYIAQGDRNAIFGEKSIHAFDKICQNLKAGEYFIRVKLTWPNQAQYNTAVLSVYSNDEGIEIEQLEKQQGQEMMKSLWISRAPKAVRVPWHDGNWYTLDNMKGQLVFIAHTNMPGNLTATFNFHYCQLTCLELDIGKISDYQLQATLSKGHPGVTTITMPTPSKSNSLRGNIDLKFNMN